MEIRIIKIEDALKMARLFREYISGSVSRESTKTEGECKNWIEGHIQNRTAVFIGAFCAQKCVGFITLYKSYSSINLTHYWTLNDLYIDEKERGKGTSHELLGFAEEYAMSTKAKGIALETAVDNTLARGIYERRGYHENKLYKTYFKKFYYE